MFNENPLERLHVSLVHLQINDWIDGSIGVGHHDRDHCVCLRQGNRMEHGQNNDHVVRQEGEEINPDDDQERQGQPQLLLFAGLLFTSQISGNPGVSPDPFLEYSLLYDCSSLIDSMLTLVVAA